MDEPRPAMPVVPPTELGLPQIVAALAHDMKNPLAALTNNLHFVVDAEGAAAGERAEALEDSIVVAEQLDHLLRNLELCGRGGAASSRSGPVALATLIDDAVHRATRMARAAGVTI